MNEQKFEESKKYDVVSAVNAIASGALADIVWTNDEALKSIKENPIMVTQNIDNMLTSELTSLQPDWFNLLFVLVLLHENYKYHGLCDITGGTDNDSEN